MIDAFATGNRSRVEIVGAGGGRAEPTTPPPKFMSTDAHFWVKIGFKFQSLGKISNISAADPPPSSFRPIPTLNRSAIRVLHKIGLNASRLI